MLSSELKEEWLEKIRKSENKRIFNHKHYLPFNVMTDLYCAPEEIRIDKEITMIALLESDEFVWNIHESFKGNKQFILELFKTKYKLDIYRGLTQNLREDSEIFLMCLERNDNFSSYGALPIAIIKNKELMLKLLEKYDVYDELKTVYKYDKEINKMVFENYRRRWNDFPKRVQNSLLQDKHCVMNLIGYKPEYYKIIPKKWQVDHEVIQLATAKSSDNKSLVPFEVLQTKEFVLKAIQKYNVSLKEVDVQFYNDYDIIKEAVKMNGFDLKFANNELKNNKEIALLSIMKNSWIRIKESYISDELKKDPDIINTFMEKNINNYFNVPAEYQTRERTMKYFEKNLYDYPKLPQKYKEDFEFAYKAIQSNVKFYQELPENLKLNWELISLYAKEKANFKRNEIPIRFEQSVEDLNNQDFFKYILKQSLEAQMERLSKEKGNNREKKIKM